MRAVPLPLFVDEVVVAPLPDKLANLIVAQGNGSYGRPNRRRFAHCGFIRFLSQGQTRAQRHPSTTLVRTLSPDSSLCSNLEQEA